ncbi:nectin-1-like [Discoglossus pictus]
MSLSVNMLLYLELTLLLDGLILIFTKVGSQVIIHVNGTVSAFVGSNATLYCKAETQEYISQLTWQRKLPLHNQNFLTYFKGEEPHYITPFGEKVKFLGTGSNDGTILISNITLEDEGSYLCIFTTFPGGSKEEEIKLTIYSNPTISIQLTPAVSGPEPVVVAVCEAFAKPEAIITWGTGEIHSISMDNTTSHPNGTTTTRSQLWMVPTRSLYGMEVTCKVSQQNTTFYELRSVNLTNIQYAPDNMHIKIHINPEGIPEPECQANANPVPTYSWKLVRDNRSISDDVPLVASRYLAFSKVDNHGFGLYICDAFNSVGKSSSSIYIYRGNSIMDIQILTF